jgi:hypothetical protein
MATRSGPDEIRLACNLDGALIPLFMPYFLEKKELQIFVLHVYNYREILTIDCLPRTSHFVQSDHLRTM